MRTSWLQPGKAEWLSAEALRGREELYSTRGELENVRSSMVALPNYMNTMEQARSAALVTAADRDSEASKVKG